MQVYTPKAQQDLNSLGYQDVPVAEGNLPDAIRRLKKEKNAVLLAHYYQDSAIQDLADYVGDSLGLSQQAAGVDADIILFAGVHFMAETAKIINPEKKVILPDLKAGCSLAESCSGQDLKEFRDRHPDHLVVTYINASAEVKAYSDLVCTSSNAEKIINSIPRHQPIIFAPDRNLGRYINEKTGRNMLLWDGACVVHEAFSIEKLLDLISKYPRAKVLAHPESEAHILKVADYIGSTSGIINYAKNSEDNEFIIATEVGILHKMQNILPEKSFIPAPSRENNTCACSECHYMKLNTLEKVYLCLKHELPEIVVDEAIRKQAIKPIKKMLELSQK